MVNEKLNNMKLSKHQCALLLALVKGERQDRIYTLNCEKTLIQLEKKLVKLNKTKNHENNN